MSESVMRVSVASWELFDDITGFDFSSVLMSCAYGHWLVYDSVKKEKCSYRIMQIKL